jgi:DNA-binding protein YbaB
MDELSNLLVVGRSAAGPSGGGGGILGIGGDGGRRGGVKVTFNGHQRPVSVEVDPRFLFSSPSSSGVGGGGGGDASNAARGAGGVTSAEVLSDAIADAMRDGYERSGRVMDDKLRGLYEQLGLPRDPAPLPSNNAQDEKGK